MGNSTEKPIRITCGEWAPDEKGNLKWPPETKKNTKHIPASKEIIPEGEMSIELGNCTYEKDENGKIVNVQEVPKMPEITGEYEGRIDENGEIIRDPVGSEER